jgi:hypothetical protein
VKELVLAADDLLSKWGFNDGDEPEALLDLMDERGMPYPTIDQWTATLRRLVREHLLPALDQQVEVVDIETSHNPVRARTVDGVDIEDRRRTGPAIRLTPEAVSVRIEDVLRILAEEGA